MFGFHLKKNMFESPHGTPGMVRKTIEKMVLVYIMCLKIPKIRIKIKSLLKEKLG